MLCFTEAEGHELVTFVHTFQVLLHVPHLLLLRNIVYTRLRLDHLPSILVSLFKCVFDD